MPFDFTTFRSGCNLTMCLYTDLQAHIQHRTSGAMREIASANMLTKWDEQAVDFDPIAAREFGFKRHHRFFRSRSLYIAPTVGHAMDMDVHADEWLFAGNAQNQVCTLRANAGERAQYLRIARYISIVFIHGAARNGKDLTCLALMKRR